MAKPPSPRAMAGANAQVPGMPKVNVTQQTNQGKRAPSTPKLKTMNTLRKPPTKTPKPKVPDLFKPLGGGTGEENPQVTPKNSPKGIKQQTPIKNPFGAL